MCSTIIYNSGNHVNAFDSPPKLPINRGSRIRQVASLFSALYNQGIQTIHQTIKLKAFAFAQAGRRLHLTFCRTDSIERKPLLYVFIVVPLLCLDCLYISTSVAGVVVSDFPPHSFFGLDVSPNHHVPFPSKGQHCHIIKPVTPHCSGSSARWLFLAPALKHLLACNCSAERALRLVSA